MTTPIEGCPQPDTPIRERAWTDAQEAARESACEHDWEVIHDWEGDPGVIGGTHDLCYLRCRDCGEEDYELDPSDYAPDFYDFD